MPRPSRASKFAATLSYPFIPSLFLAISLLLWPTFNVASKAQTVSQTPSLPMSPAAPSPSAPAVAVAKQPESPSPTPSLIPWRQLTWNDFRVDDTQKGLSAETVSYLRFRYKTHIDQIKDDKGLPVFTATLTNIVFVGGFDTARSWRRAAVNNAAKNGMLLLHHEQGHLDLNEIKRRQLQALPLASFPVGHGASLAEATADLSQRLGEWFRGEMFTLRARQLQYDDETKFGTNRSKQNQWSQRIAQELTATPALSFASFSVRRPCLTWEKQIAKWAREGQQPPGYRQERRKHRGHLGRRFRFCEVHATT